jgi:hypothetical protein
MLTITRQPGRQNSAIGFCQFTSITLVIYTITGQKFQRQAYKIVSKFTQEKVLSSHFFSTKSWPI